MPPEGSQSSYQAASQSRKRTRSSLDAPSPSTQPPSGGADLTSDEKSLTELESENVLVPTKLQRTNKDSRPVFQSPFDYSWVDFDDPALDGLTLPSKAIKTRAWWWKYGVPLEARVDQGNGRRAILTYFLCHTCYTIGRRSTCKLNITKGRCSARDHFRNLHHTTFEIEKDLPHDAQFDDETLLDRLDRNDPVQRRILNELTQLFNQDISNKDLLRWVVFDNIPFYKLQSPYFRTLLSRLTPFSNRSRLPTDRTVQRWVMQEFKQHKVDIRKLLISSCSQIHLSFDVWTSRRIKALNGVVAHWVDKDGKCQSALLALTELADTHGGKELCADVLRVINDYGIRERIGYFVLDNAINNDKAVELICKELCLNPRWRRLRCSGHIINIIAKEVLWGADYEMFENVVANINNLKDEVAAWRKKGPIGHLATIIRWIRRSPGRLQRFNNAQKTIWEENHLNASSDSQILSLIMNNSTRWNSTYDMIVRALRLRRAIEHFLDLETLRLKYLVKERVEKPLSERPEDSVTRIILQNRMKPDDWAIIAEIAELLEPFKDGTKKLESRPNEASASGFADVVPVLKILLENLEKLKLHYAEYPPDRPVWVAIEQAWQKASYYYRITDRTPAYTAAILLNPRLKRQYLEREWGLEDAQSGVALVKELYQKEYEELLISGPLISSQEALSEISGNRRRRKKPKFRQIDEALEETRKISLAPMIESELDSYLADRLEHNSTLAPFEFWMRPSVKAQYPRLSRMAIDILSIPAMSSEAERIFSLAGNMISPRRARLREDSVEASICLANWGRNGLVEIGEHAQELRGSQMANIFNNSGDDLPFQLELDPRDEIVLFKESLYSDNSSQVSN